MTVPPPPQRPRQTPPRTADPYAPYPPAAPYPSAVPYPPAAPAASYETRRDVEAALAARHELGPEYSDQIAEGLAERVEQLAAYRTAELRQAGQAERHGDSLDRTAQTQRFVTSLVSLGAGIPITAIAATQGGLTEVAICWLGIVGVNVAQALGARRSRR